MSQVCLRVQDGLTALMLACRKGHLSTVQCLCSNQCDVNVKNQVLLFALDDSFLSALLSVNGHRCTLLHLMATLLSLNISLITVVLMSTNRLL